MSLTPCTGCPAAYAVASATVRHDGNGLWRRVPDETPAHLVALFRDPQIQAGRRIEVVLDLAPDTAPCRLPRWLGPFLHALARLPVGLTVVLDNGVRCPCGKAMGRSTYFARASLCLERTRAMVTARRHPDGDARASSSATAISLTRSPLPERCHCVPVRRGCRRSDGSPR